MNKQDRRLSFSVSMRSDRKYKYVLCRYFSRTSINSCVRMFQKDFQAYLNENRKKAADILQSTICIRGHTYCFLVFQTFV